jgi:hypothetical protein
MVWYGTAHSTKGSSIPFLHTIPYYTPYHAIPCIGVLFKASYGTVRYGTVWYGMVWYGMVWYGMVWYGMVRYGMVRYGMVW